MSRFSALYYTVLSIAPKFLCRLLFTYIQGKAFSANQQQSKSVSRAIS